MEQRLLGRSLGVMLAGSRIVRLRRLKMRGCLGDDLVVGCRIDRAMKLVMTMQGRRKVVDLQREKVCLDFSVFVVGNNPSICAVILRSLWVVHLVMKIIAPI